MGKGIIMLLSHNIAAGSEHFDIRSPGRELALLKIIEVSNLLEIAAMKDPGAMDGALPIPIFHEIDIAN